MTNSITNSVKEAGIFLSMSLLLSLAAFAQEKTNFSGSWSVNFDKSELGEQIKSNIVSEMNIQQSGEGKAAVIIINSTFENVVDKDTLYMDGREFKYVRETNNNDFSMVTTSIKTTKWSVDGQSLMTTYTMDNKSGDESKIKSSVTVFVTTYTLSKDGKNLTVEYGDENNRIKITYDKK